MEISQYWVGQIPLRPLTITVRTSDGLPLNALQYDGFRVRLIGSDNEEIDTTGSVLDLSGAQSGRFLFRWPTDRSLFNKTGDYVLQMILSRADARDITSTHTLRVRDAGRLNR